MFALRRALSVSSILVCLATPAFAGFGSTETYLPTVGRVPGKYGAQFYTTVWATNLTSAPQTFTFEFLKTGQTNPSPASFHDTLQPGETKVYENVVQSKLGLSDALGAARILSSGEIFVSERIYNQSPGDDLGNTEGLFFAGVPKGFSIAAGQSASIQGIDQGGSENFRYNFALIETGGGNPKVNVQVFDGSGTMLGQKAYPLLPWEHVQVSVDDVVPGIATTNARITATVAGGSGSVLLAGAQVANESQDSSGFEMTFRDSLLGGGGGGTAGVTSLNGLTGALTLKPGSGISITPSGSQISIAYTGGGGSGLTSVTHDASLAGVGTGTSPLGIANGQVVRSVNGLHDTLTLAAGSNVTITPSGSTLTIASTGGGGGGGLTLPFSGTTSSSNPGFSMTNTGSGIGIQGTTSGSGGTVAGVSGTCQTNVLCAGVQGTGQTGLAAHGTATGLYAESTAANSVALYAVNGASSGYIAHFENGFGVDRVTIDTKGNLVASSIDSSTAAVKGLNQLVGVGVLGRAGSGSGLGGTVGETGVWGDSNYGVFGSGSTVGVWGLSDVGFGIMASSTSNDALKADSYSGDAVVATSTTGHAGTFNGNVQVNGNLSYSGSLTHSSDARFKENTAPIEGALDGVLRLHGVTFDWRRDEFPERRFRAGRDLGFIAQEVEEVYPELVATDRDGYKSVDYSALTPILVEAIRTQQKKIAEQQQEIDELIQALKASSILNPDGSINLETAHRLGWDRRESWKRAENKN